MIYVEEHVDGASYCQPQNYDLTQRNILHRGVYKLSLHKCESQYSFIR